MQKTYFWHKKEDSWAILIGLGIVAAATILFLADAANVLHLFNMKVSGWSSAADLGPVLTKIALPALSIFTFLAVILTIGAATLGFLPQKFLKGFIFLYILALLVTVLGANTYVKAMQLESPLLALIVGLAIGNFIGVPAWFSEAVRTEYYVKTGIVLMGATLPFTIILQAGPAAIIQALIVSIVTFVSIYLAATRLFHLDRRFAACLGAGGSICGVSSSIAIGGACRARQEHVSIAISLVVVWAVAMIFFLPFAAKALELPAGIAGAWIGTSEFADAAGFAAAEAIGDEAAIRSFTLMKVVGRDMFVGIWAFIVAVLSVTLWERTSLNSSERVDKREIWNRFPKFIIGFFAASLLTTFAITSMDPAVAGAYNKEAMVLFKSFRGWFFVLTFLSIGLTTRFRELALVGWKPFLAFAIGVAINVPIGYYLSNHVFADFWLDL